MNRKELYKLVLGAIQRQVAQEARHLRRLHVAFHYLTAMGEVEGQRRNASEMVDQLILQIGQDVGPRDIRDMLGALSSRPSSSIPPPSTTICRRA